MCATFSLLVKWQLCIPSRLASVMHCCAHQPWFLRAEVWPGSYLGLISWLSGHGHVTQAFQSGWKHPAAGCPSANSSVWEASLFPSKSLCVRHGGWFCAHRDFLHSSFSNLPHPDTWLVTKSCCCHHLLWDISHPAEWTRNLAVDEISSRRMEATGWEQSPSIRDNSCGNGILVTVDRSFHLSVCLNDLLWK